MKLKKLLSLFAAAAIGASCFAGLGISASAATINDAAPITSDYTYWFDDATSNGTVKPTANALFGDDHFFTSSANTVASNKGNATVGGTSHLYSLRLKNVQDTLAFKVSDAAKITFYTQSHNSRGIVITNSAPSNKDFNGEQRYYNDYSEATTGETEKNVEPVLTTEWIYKTSGAETIYLSSYGGDFYIAGIVVDVENDVEDKEYTTVYDIPGHLMTFDSGFAYQGSVGTMVPTSADEAANAPKITLDATSGKIGRNSSDWAQFNNGSKIEIPDVASGSVISIKIYRGDTEVSVKCGSDEQSFSTNPASYTATSSGKVTITSTHDGQAYIGSITITGPAFGSGTDEPEQTETPAAEGYTNTWYFGKANGAPEFALERSPEYTYEANGYSLVVNTDAGKLNNASRTDALSQCNDGTTFKVPVYAGSKLTWDKYNKGDTTGFKVDDVLYNDYYIAAEDGTAALKAQGIGYLASIKIEPVAVYDVTGTISGGELGGSTITFTAANGQPYSLPITGSTFSGKLPADTYSLSLAADAAYVIDKPSTLTVNAAGDLGAITVTAASEQTVSGEITNAPAEAFTLTFTGSGTNAPVQLELEANATSYSLDLTPDTYTVSSSAGTLSPLSQESFTVVKDAVDFDLYYPEPVPAAASNEITVGKDETYTSISDALAAIKAAGLSKPVITLHSGETYREQVIVDIPDVTFKTDGKDKATITWYYGIGYSYYSLADNGCYDKDRAMTRHSIKKVEPARWGAAVLVRGSGFKAENIIFENSFNRYYTTEEVKDGVKPSGIQAITVDRQAQTVKADSKQATERAAAIGFENDPQNCELYNCEFLGSQDTFYTSGSIYVRDCKITGNTDYIFGGGNIVFDNCDLIWGGYSEGSTGGYITACNGGTYIFRDCTVKNGTEAGRTVNGGNLGRDWGGETAHVYYFNLKDDTNGKTGWSWTNMGGAVASGKADLHIYSFDPDTNALYDSTGPEGANVNGLLTMQQAFDLYFRTEVKSGIAPAMAAAEKDKDQADFTNEADENDKASLWEATVSSSYAASKITAIAFDNDGNSARDTIRIGEGISGPVSVYVAVNKSSSDIAGLAVVLN